MRDKEKYNAYQRVYQLERSRKRRAQAVEMLGGRCASCGIDSKLEIDHIDWRNKELNIAKLWSVAIARFVDELTKCQLLCEDCHREKTRVDVSEMWTEKWSHRRRRETKN